MTAGDRLAARFAAEVERGRLADAYLLVGRSRAALRALALQCAGRYLRCRGEPGAHPECVVLDPAELGVTGLKVEHIAVRKEGTPSLELALRYRATGEGRRCVLLHDVDRMNTDAQAALLKTSEEPPAGTLLVLTAADLSPLLPALRSRCRTYRQGTLPRAEAASRGVEAGMEAGQMEVLAAACGLEAALELAPAERDRLLALHEAYLGWRAGGSPGGLLAAPAGASLAEQRVEGRSSLGAFLGWLVQDYARAGEAQALRMDRAASGIQAAIGDLEGNLSPAVVFEDLLSYLEGQPLPV